MREYRKSANPFYALLVVTGVVFVVTATAYLVMTIAEDRAAEQVADQALERHPLIEWMRRHGNTALLSELGFLAVFTFGAIGTDDYWQRRGARERRQRDESNANTAPSMSRYANEQFQALLDEERRTHNRTEDESPP